MIGKRPKVVDMLTLQREVYESVSGLTESVIDLGDAAQEVSGRIRYY